jgi:hypothetical protein
MASTSRADLSRAIFAAYLARDRKFVEDAFSRPTITSKIIFTDMSVA